MAGAMGMRMARLKTSDDSMTIKQSIAARLTELRSDLYGDRGGKDMARALGIPGRTWYHYENGVTVPGETMLKIIEVTAVEPLWLLRGDEPKFRKQ